MGDQHKPSWTFQTLDTERTASSSLSSREPRSARLLVLQVRALPLTAYLRIQQQIQSFHSVLLQVDLMSLLLAERVLALGLTLVRLVFSRAK